jgi:hypothetical protein
VILPCKLIDPLRENDGEPVFKDQNLLTKVLVEDCGPCGGHGRALELLAKHIENIQCDVSAVRSFLRACVR